MASLLNGNHYKIYYRGTNINAICVNLLHFAFGQFNRATHIKKLDGLKSIFIEDDKIVDSLSDEKKDKMTEFIFDGLIDSIRIIICYENFMKSILLSKKFLVHEIDKKVDDKYHNIQKREPVNLDEYLEKHPWIKDNSLGYHVLPGITKRTIKFSSLLKKKYSDVMLIPDSIIEIVKNHYSKRNEIHFYMEERFNYSMKTISEWEELRDYTNKVIANCNNKIIVGSKLPDRHLIKLE